MRRAPKYVHGFIDRHGRPRFYFRRRGFKEVPLPGLPWSPTFMNAYEQALAGQAIEIGASRVKPGTMRALAISFFNSPSFHALRPTTRSTYRNIITRLCEQRDNNDHPIGDKAAAGLRREHVVKLMAAAKPDSANGLRKALRAMMRHAVEVGLRADDPTRDEGDPRQVCRLSQLDRRRDRPIRESPSDRHARSPRARLVAVYRPAERRRGAHGQAASWSRGNRRRSGVDHPGGAGKDRRSPCHSGPPGFGGDPRRYAG
jgi:hypothetical protein